MLGGIVCCAWGLPARYTRVLSPYDDMIAFRDREDELLTYVVKAAAAVCETMTWDPTEDTRPKKAIDLVTPSIEVPLESPTEAPLAVIRLARACDLDPLDLMAIMSTWEDEVRLFVEHVLTP